ncbi:hypothetical protein VE03_07839 [Pseudogymnoascus sp. 23342-1-I1]|nr:hypothetical protein VE03_07839 [Pseudogymnoascus sp. 23342-1-I1]
MFNKSNPVIPPVASLERPEPLTTVLANDREEFRDDCLPCRVTGAAAFAGLGIYSYYSGHAQLLAQQKAIAKSGSMFGLKSRQTGITGIAITLDDANLREYNPLRVEAGHPRTAQDGPMIKLNSTSQMAKIHLVNVEKRLAQAFPVGSVRDEQRLTKDFDGHHKENSNARAYWTNTDLNTAAALEVAA